MQADGREPMRDRKDLAFLPGDDASRISRQQNYLYVDTNGRVEICPRLSFFDEMVTRFF
jgi:hypothetical protein